MSTYVNVFLRGSLVDFGDLVARGPGRVEIASGRTPRPGAVVQDVATYRAGDGYRWDEYPDED